MGRLNRLFFLLLSCCLSCNPSIPTDENALLWEVFANNDSEHPSYLFGTYHGNGIKGNFADSIPGLGKAFNSVTQYIGESDFSLLDSEEMQGFYREWLGEISMPVDTSYKVLLSKADYEYVDFLVRFHLRMFMDRGKHIPKTSFKEGTDSLVQLLRN